MSNHAEFTQYPIDQTLGVEEDLRKFAMNEYLRRNDHKNVIGSNDLQVEEDDLPIDDILATNGIDESNDKPIEENSDLRYSKEVRSYLNVSSSARSNQIPLQINTDISAVQGFLGGSLMSSDGIYSQFNQFAPFMQNDGKIIITSNNNHMTFSIREVTESNMPRQIVNALSNPVWDIFINLGAYEPIQLAETLQKVANNMVYRETGLSDLFSIEAYIDNIINTDRVTIIIRVKPPYQFVWTFYDNSVPTLDQLSSAQQGLLTLHDSFAPQSSVAYKNLAMPNTASEYYPNPNHYVLQLHKSYTNVKSIRIIASEIPNTETIINMENNHISFAIRDKTRPNPSIENPFSQHVLKKDGNIYWNLYIAPGDYTVSELAKEIELSINNMIFGEANLSNVFSITADLKKGIFEIAVTNPYSFIWNFNSKDKLAGRNLYKMLGFASPMGLYPGHYMTNFNNLITINTGTSSQPIYVQIPHGRFNLKKLNIIWLKLNNYETIYDTFTQKYYFTKFTVDQNNENPVEIDSYTETQAVFENNPIPLLNSLEVSFYDEAGNPYNFNNIDHSFTLEIVHNLDRLSNTDYNSYRGVNNQTNKL